jgi:hypothetical protein
MTSPLSPVPAPLSPEPVQLPLIGGGPANPNAESLPATSPEVIKDTGDRLRRPLIDTRNITYREPREKNFAASKYVSWSLKKKIQWLNAFPGSRQTTKRPLLKIPDEFKAENRIVFRVSRGFLPSPS